MLGRAGSRAVPAAASSLLSPAPVLRYVKQDSLHVPIHCHKLFHRCRCWLNSFCTWIFTGPHFATFWHAQPEVSEADLLDTTSKSTESVLAKALYQRLLLLHRSMAAAGKVSSVHGVWKVIGHAFPKLHTSTKIRGVECFQHQDIDEALKVVLPLVVQGMQESGITEKVNMSPGL